MPGKALQIQYLADPKSVLAAQKKIDAGHGKMQGSTKKTGGLFSTVFGSAIPLNAAVAAAAVVAGAGAVIKAAADEGEALNKAKVIFGDSAESVIRFSDTSATAFGVSKAAALEAAGGFGAMFDTAGLAERASSDMSVTMVQLASDMASFNNEDPSDMLERLRSGLSGEAEPLRQFGVFISAARVETEAYAAGIATAGEELTEAQKVQARYNLIMADTARQQGDFARTSDSLPNMLRSLGAELTDLAADFGQTFLPVIIDAVSLIGDVVGVLGDLNTAITSPTQAIRDFDAAWRQGTTTIEDVAQGLKDQSLTVIEAAENLLKLREETGLAIDVSLEFVEALKQERVAAFDLTSVMVPAHDAISNAAGAIQAATDASQENADALRDQRDATLAANDAFLAIYDSANQLAEAQRVLNRLERKGREDTKAYEAAVLDAFEAQSGLDGAVSTFAENLVDAGVKQRDVEQAIRDAAKEMGVSKGAVGDLITKIRGYINSLNDIPSNVHTNVSASLNFVGAVSGAIAENINFAAHGFHGEVRRPTMFVAGEAGRERVDITPHSAMGRGGGGSGGAPSITINVAGSLIGTSPRELARLMAEHIDAELNHQRRRNGRLALDP